ncbi:hypothetical protein BI323_16320 [Yersinia ruckeri]|uniref:Uncharacterized protein n=3 Tax=Yersinia ruckeri TaxID=29486 RepID=A0A0A8V9W4_YERRU|nr:hypothetical protein [Yersinia ruckeri]EKN4199651.1 hypothetical protein [Yersinia ruckeri]EKN4206284.1 hypothetical protein [Yersinia ruckeri]EKN4703604.1 hypothetical protein [Yersinia ruckeri]KGA49662.1 putative nADH dehydrogenase subunit 6 [Yersinia ruckeri ATCC 29473]MCK8596597.1 hypothetical protein [Yersinia ruckeri]
MTIINNYSTSLPILDSSVTTVTHKSKSNDDINKIIKNLTDTLKNDKNINIKTAIQYIHEHLKGIDQKSSNQIVSEFFSQLNSSTDTNDITLLKEVISPAYTLYTITKNITSEYLNKILNESSNFDDDDDEKEIYR